MISLRTLWPQLIGSKSNLHHQQVIPHTHTRHTVWMTLQLWQRWLSERTMANQQRSLIMKPNTDVTCPNVHGCTPIWTNAHPRTPKATHTHSNTRLYPCLETKWYSTQSNPSITAGDPWKTNMWHTFLSSNNHLLRQMIVSYSLDYCAARSCPHKSRERHYFLILLILLWHNVFTSSYIQ